MIGMGVIPASAMQMVRDAKAGKKITLPSGVSSIPAAAAQVVNAAKAKKVVSSKLTSDQIFKIATEKPGSVANVLVKKIAKRVSPNTQSLPILKISRPQSATGEKVDPEPNQVIPEPEQVVPVELEPPLTVPPSDTPISQMTLSHSSTGSASQLSKLAMLTGVGIAVLLIFKAVGEK